MKTARTYRKHTAAKIVASAVRAKIGSNYIRFSEGVCLVQFGDCWDIVIFADLMPNIRKN
jgi:hypothetical protein